MGILVYGRITKRGSKEARWILTQIILAASRKKNSKMKGFFNRKKKSFGHSKPIIALARKITIIFWHLFVNDEIYEDDTGYKKEEIQKGLIGETVIISVDECIKIISGIFAIVEKENKESTLGRYTYVLSCQTCAWLKKEFREIKAYTVRLIKNP